MNSKSDKKSIAALCGAVVTGLTAASLANAAENPFALKDLSSGYVQVAAEEKQKEMACGEGKCGAQMMKSGAMKDVKGMEGKCAGMTKGAQETKPAEGQGNTGEKDGKEAQQPGK
ncbi:MAG TPA: hypothetical protein VI457_13570 [Methylococcaceae bacterium]|nr:hypothetical protein [Methylococcaceae bacterium]